jgi:hypothetical protein
MDRRKFIRLSILGLSILTVIIGGLWFIKNKAASLLQEKNSVEVTHNDNSYKKTEKGSKTEENRSSVAQHSSATTATYQRKSEKSDKVEGIIKKYGIDNSEPPAYRGNMQPYRAKPEPMSPYNPYETNKLSIPKIDTDKIAEIVAEKIAQKPEFLNLIVQKALGIKNPDRKVLDISKFELQKTALQRDIELLKLLLQKAKLQKEYQRVLNPPEEVKAKEVEALKMQIINLKKEIKQLKAKLAKASIEKQKERKQEKKEGFEITIKPTPEQLLNQYSGTFTSVVQIGDTIYVFDKNGNTYKVGDILPGGTKIVAADIYGVVVEKQGVKVKVPLSTSSSTKKQLPF